MSQLATNSPSAGVYSKENDRSQRVSAEGTSVGAIVGASNRGPVMTPTLVVDGTDFKNRFGNKDARIGYMHYCAEAFLKEASRLQVIRIAIDSKYGGAFITTHTNLSKPRSIALGLDSIDDAPFTLEDILFICGKDQGTWNNDLTIVFYPDTSDPLGDSFWIEVYEGSNAVASERHLCKTYDFVNGNGVQLFVEDVINNGSDLIQVKFNDQHPALANNPKNILINSVGSMKLSGGDNGKPFSLGDPECVAKVIEAWDILSDWELVDINILINAGLTLPAIQLKMDQIANSRQDCIAILDVPSDQQTAQKAVDYRRNTLNLNSSWSACYAPDVLVRDSDNGRDLYVPPSGHVAARYVYTDKNTAAWFAPGGMDRGKLEGVLGLREKYKRGHLDTLAENQVNSLINVVGSGAVIWGADTMYAVPSALNDVGVRRLLAMLHASVRINNLYAVFQPIDNFLMSQQRSSIEQLLEPILIGRGLEEYEVICDDRNNPSYSIANGDLIVDVYLTPVRYAKRIHLNVIVPKKGELQATVALAQQN